MCSNCPDLRGFQTDDVCLGHRAEQEIDAPEGCMFRVLKAPPGRVNI